MANKKMPQIKIIIKIQMLVKKAIQMQKINDKHNNRMLVQIINEMKIFKIEIQNKQEYIIFNYFYLIKCKKY